METAVTEQTVQAPSPPAEPPERKTSAAGDESSWPLRDRVMVRLCWATGIVLCLIAGAIIVYMAVQGLRYINLDLITSRPAAAVEESQTGGFLDPLIGTLLLAGIGIVLAVPIGTAIAVWLVEYGRPGWLARLVESGVEVIAGTPTIVLAIFGLAVFQQPLFSWLSFSDSSGAVSGQSFLTAGMIMSLIAVPLVVGATREALQSIPAHVREASYSLGKTRAATIRRVLLPAVRPGIGTGAALGMGRIIGDTAIVVILLGATLRLEEANGVPGLGTLQGFGSTLTSFVYVNSPAGEGDAPEKAFAAAFVLLMLVIALNMLVGRVSRAGKGVQWGR